MVYSCAAENSANVDLSQPNERTSPCASGRPASFTLGSYPWLKPHAVPEVDQFAQAFSVAGEKREKVPDEATVALLTKLPFNSDLEKAKAAIGRRAIQS
jgi:hypothetical protein